jgi:prostaglandin-H2 D-isomerase / glutathione transferase
MASVPRLTYFNGRGRAELARLIFAAAGQPYEDVRVTSLQELKASGKLPFDQVPTLEVDGVVYAQSAAINRYLARRYGLMGSTPEEALHIDMLYEGVIDMRTQQNSIPKAPEDVKVAETDKFAKETLPRWFGYYERQLAANHGGDGFLVGDRLSLADLALTNFVYLVLSAFPKALETAPKLAAHYKRISEHSGVAEWLKKRPETPW